MRIVRFAVIFAVTTAIFFCSNPATAFEASVYPTGIRPGDPFLLRLTVDLAVHGTPYAAINEANGSEINFTACGDGCYLGMGAVDLETEPGGLSITVTLDGEQRTIPLEVLEADFPSQSITLPDTMVNLSKADEARADREAEEMSSLWSQASTRYWRGDFIMPLQNEFSTVFGARRVINNERTSIHRGIDIRGAEGEPVIAANRGAVAYVENTFFGGNTVIIDHGQGVFTVYMHLSGVDVVERELVIKGQVIGYVGSTGRSTGPHLHFGLKVGGMSASPTAMGGLPLDSSINGKEAVGGP